MAQLHTIKQLEERNVASEINFMVWSDRMDLVAFSNTKGEVALHRLTWTRAWYINPPQKHLIVKGIAWRPDGKVLAIAYNSGQILLVSLESKTILNTVEIGCDISCIYWLQEKIDVKSKEFLCLTDEEQNEYLKYTDFSSVFLSEPQPQSSSNSSDQNPISNILQNQSELNLLLIGTITGCVYVNIFGYFTCALVNVNTFIGSNCTIETIHLTENLSKMFITVKDSDNNIKIVFIDSTIFKLHRKELFTTALKYVRLTNLLNYLSNTITTITETLESILLEMDTKLSKYASKVPEGGVTADFLDLLMFGICSEQMKEFLIFDLTKKGLEKFGHTIELNYANIQKLLLKYVTKFGQNITYHLSELRGMARLEQRYGVIGMSEENITKAIQSNGSFLIKVGEMQQIINQSIVNYKAFFRWLYTAIMQLMDETIPNEIPKMTQQDLAHIAEFLQNFDNIGLQSNQFKMERLGQYLNDSNLTIQPNMNENSWSNFLSQNQCVQNHPSILKHYSNMSLTQQFNQLKNSVESIFTKPRDCISQQINVVHVLNCFNFGEETIRTSHINLSKEIAIFAFLKPPDNMYLLQTHVDKNNCMARCGNFYFPQFLSNDQESSGSNYNILDLKFYSNNILSILLEENTSAKVPVLYQFPLALALETLNEISIHGDIYKENVIVDINGSNFVPKLFKNIEGMVASQFAVSGSRRVCIVLSENKRKVRLFEMEGEEEDDDEAEMSSSVVKESDVTDSSF